MDWINQNPNILFWLQIPALWLHQFEEYIYPGGFLKWFNQKVMGSKAPYRPLTKYHAVLINVPLGWGGLTIAAFIGTEILWLAMLGVIVAIGNTIFHNLEAVLSRRYSPGMISSLVIYLPLCSYTVYFFYSKEEISNRAIILVTVIIVLWFIALQWIKRSNRAE